MDFLERSTYNLLYYAFVRRRQQFISIIITFTWKKYVLVGINVHFIIFSSLNK